MGNGSRNGFCVYSYMLAQAVQGATAAAAGLFSAGRNEKQQKAIPNDRFAVDDNAV
ncbi:hypothetical protein [Brachymonas denitrificans]|jgi:hypothetical protein|uniref:hypothetical protein n=1 Tax=Brachymonas denitrificans TaxID=28220 RepID=UPI00352E092E